MKIEDHLKNLKESLEEIKSAVQTGVVERQRTIGFHCLSAAMDMLEILLHKNNLIDYGFILKHEWFLSKRKIEEKLPFDFPNKQKIISLIMQIEEKRNILCYGKRQEEKIVENVVTQFNELKEKFIESEIDEIKELEK